MKNGALKNANETESMSTVNRSSNPQYRWFSCHYRKVALFIQAEKKAQTTFMLLGREVVR